MMARDATAGGYDPLTAARESLQDFSARGTHGRMDEDITLVLGALAAAEQARDQAVEEAAKSQFVMVRALEKYEEQRARATRLAALEAAARAWADARARAVWGAIGVLEAQANLALDAAVAALDGAAGEPS
jgi:hypothetical protein